MLQVASSSPSTTTSVLPLLSLLDAPTSSTHLPSPSPTTTLQHHQARAIPSLLLPPCLLPHPLREQYFLGRWDLGAVLPDFFSKPSKSGALTIINAPPPSLSPVGSLSSFLLVTFLCWWPCLVERSMMMMPIVVGFRSSSVSVLYICDRSVWTC